MESKRACLDEAAPAAKVCGLGVHAEFMAWTSTSFVLAEVTAKSFSSETCQRNPQSQNSQNVVLTHCAGLAYLGALPSSSEDGHGRKGVMRRRRENGAASGL